MNYRISVRARGDLIDIYTFTNRRFGRYQADAYHAGLERTFGLLAEFPGIGISADEVVPGHRRFRFQSHYIFYTAEPDHVMIRALVRVRQDLRPDLFELRSSDGGNRASEDLGPHIQRFSVSHVDARALIEATPEFWEYPMCDRDPLPRWSHGRVTLLGDAAHPMYPVGSNGASQAILDARCLADRLVSAEHARQALWGYEQERLPMTAQIVQMNRKGGPEGVIDVVEELAPDGFANIDDVLSYEDRKAIVRGYASTAGFAQAQVNKPGKAA